MIICTMITNIYKTQKKVTIGHDHTMCAKVTISWRKLIGVDLFTVRIIYFIVFLVTIDNVQRI